MMQQTGHFASEICMLKFGVALAQQLTANDLVFLEGALGAGKTTLTRGILQGLGHQGAVKSPTYTLVEPYHLVSGLTVFHFDLYRISAPNALLDIGFEEYLDERALLLIEWPEKAGALLPLPTLRCVIEMAGDARNITLRASGTRGKNLLASLPGLLS